MTDEMRTLANALIEKSTSAFVASIDEQGDPNIKAMFSEEHDGVKIFYFSTNVSARRTADFIRNPRASIYFCDQENDAGVLLVGRMEVCRERELRERLWHDGDELYYPTGIDDPDYCVLRFTAEHGNIYYNCEKMDFLPEEL